MKKILKCLLSLVLCAIMASQAVTSVMAVGPRPSVPGERTGSVVKYLRDLMLAYGETEEEAKKKLTDKGYAVVNVNLNPGEKKDYPYVYLGYTTTTDPKLAITDIAAINMNGDYSMEQYDKVLEDSYAYFRVIGEFYETLAGAFKQRYFNGVFHEDLSRDAGGYYMNLLYKRTPRDWEAITGIVQLSVDKASQAPTNIDYKGITYTKIQDGDCPDLNKGAGGKYVYLYTTKDTRLGGPITDLKVMIDNHADQRLDPGYSWVKEVHSGQRGDLNQDAGGAWVFLGYTREWYLPEDPPDEPPLDLSWIDDWLGLNTGGGIASFFSVFTPASYVIVGVFLGAFGTAFVIGIVQKRKKKKAEE